MRRWEPADANANEIAIDAVSLDPLRDELQVGHAAIARVDRLVNPF
jgi:hypothetical protein